MMYGELYQYFIQYKKLNVPGIGTFLLERKPATSDFPNKIINAPSYSITLHHSNNVTPSKSFFSWLAAILKISDRDAIIRFNDFVFDLKKKIGAGDKINWSGVGTLSSGLAGEIRFDPALKDAILEPPVKAEKVIREHAEHIVRVGEDEKTSTEMIDYLSHQDRKKTPWWALALVIGLLILMFLGWYFSQYGIQTSSTGNGQKLRPTESSATYKSLP